MRFTRREVDFFGLASPEGDLSNSPRNWRQREVERKQNLKKQRINWGKSLYGQQTKQFEQIVIFHFL